MEMEHRFLVMTSVERAWVVLNDVERVAPCLPGATLDSVEGDVFTGAVRVKLGPVTMVYTGSAKFTERDVARRRVVMHADARAARGGGTAKAVVYARLTEEAAGSTRVDVKTELAITGKPAQFGRALIIDVGNAFFEEFSARLAAEMTGTPDASQTPPETAGAVIAPVQAQHADLVALLRRMVLARLARIGVSWRRRLNATRKAR